MERRSSGRHDVVVVVEFVLCEYLKPVFHASVSQEATKSTMCREYCSTVDPHLEHSVIDTPFVEVVCVVKSMRLSVLIGVATTAYVVRSTAVATAATAVAVAGGGGGSGPACAVRHRVNTSAALNGTWHTRNISLSARCSSMRRIQQRRRGGGGRGVGSSSSSSSSRGRRELLIRNI